MISVPRPLPEPLKHKGAAALAVCAPARLPAPQENATLAHIGCSSGKCPGTQVLQTGALEAQRLEVQDISASLQKCSWSSPIGLCVLRAARAGGCAQRQLCLAKMGLRHCPGRALCAHGQPRKLCPVHQTPTGRAERQELDAGLFYFKHSKEQTRQRGTRHGLVVCAGFPRAAPSGWSMAGAVEQSNKRPVGAGRSPECGHGQGAGGGEAALGEGEGRRRERRTEAEGSRGLWGCWWRL